MSYIMSTFQIWKELVPFNTFLEEPREPPYGRKACSNCDSAKHPTRFTMASWRNRTETATEKSSSITIITFWIQPENKNVLRYMADSWQLVPANRGRFRDLIFISDRHSTTSKPWVHLMQLTHHLIAAQWSHHIFTALLCYKTQPAPARFPNLSPTLATEIVLKPFFWRVQTWFFTSLHYWCDFIFCGVFAEQIDEHKMQTWNS